MVYEQKIKVITAKPDDCVEFMLCDIFQWFFPGSKTSVVDSKYFNRVFSFMFLSE